MIEKNAYLVTTIITIALTIAFSLVTYLRSRSLEFTEIIIYAIVFWIAFFLGQKYFSKKKS